MIKIKDENKQYDINREAAKISAVKLYKYKKLYKIDKYKYITGKKILKNKENLHILHSIKHLKSK